MKLLPAGLNASSKQLKVLGVLVVILIGALIYNFASSSTPVPMTANGPVGANPAPLKPVPTTPVSLPAPKPRTQNRRAETFRPSLKLKEGTDVSKIDPTLRLELLAKLKNAEMKKAGRAACFAFGAAPPPPEDLTLHPGPMTRMVGPMPPPPPVDPAKLERERAERAGESSAAGFRMRSFTVIRRRVEPSAHFSWTLTMRSRWPEKTIRSRIGTK